jgi:polyisoprenoid-binding protein YceI
MPTPHALSPAPLSRAAALAALLVPSVPAAAPSPVVPAGRQVYEADSSASHLALRTGRAGLFGFLGHEHGVHATRWTGRLCLDPASLAGSRAEVSVPVEDLRIDTPEARRLVGLDPEGGPDAEGRAELQRKLLSPEVLDAERYPTIELLTNVIESARPDSATADADVSIHGRTQRVRIGVGVTGLDGGRVRLAGEFRIRQRDFGIKPESKAGVVSVSDELKIRFDFVAVPSGRTC